MNKKHVIGYAATALVSFAIGSSGGGDAPDQAPAGSSVAGSPASTTTVTLPAVTSTVTAQKVKTVTAPPPAPAVAMEGDGAYEVGVDVKPVTYVSASADSGNCYWARLTGEDGLDGIIANGNSAGRVIVTIRKSDKFFASSGCSSWTRR